MWNPGGKIMKEGENRMFIDVRVRCCASSSRRWREERQYWRQIQQVARLHGVPLRVASTSFLQRLYAQRVLPCRYV